MEQQLATATKIHYIYPSTYGLECMDCNMKSGLNYEQNQLTDAYSVVVRRDLEKMHNPDADLLAFVRQHSAHRCSIIKTVHYCK